MKMSQEQFKGFLGTEVKGIVEAVPVIGHFVDKENLTGWKQACSWQSV
jgi:hypothetical protein